MRDIPYCPIRYIKSINGTIPTSNGKFTIEPGTAIHIAHIPNGLKISALNIPLIEYENTDGNVIIDHDMKTINLADSLVINDNIQTDSIVVNDSIQTDSITAMSGQINGHDILTKGTISDGEILYWDDTDKIAKGTTINTEYTNDDGNVSINNTTRKIDLSSSLSIDTDITINSKHAVVRDDVMTSDKFVKWDGAKLITADIPASEKNHGYYGHGYIPQTNFDGNTHTIIPYPGWMHGGAVGDDSLLTMNDATGEFTVSKNCLAFISFDLRFYGIPSGSYSKSYQVWLTRNGTGDSSSIAPGLNINKMNNEATVLYNISFSCALRTGYTYALNHAMSPITGAYITNNSHYSISLIEV